MRAARSMTRLSLMQEYRFFSARTFEPSSLYKTRCAGRCVAARAEETGSNIEPPNVKKLAKLAQIAVSDEEAAEWEPKLKEIVHWFDQLQKIDVEGVPPCSRSSLTNLLAAGKDEPVEFENREALLQGIPEREGPYVKVPKIL